MAKTALALLATGTEEMEIVIVVDVLRRAGVTVTIAGLLNEPLKCSRNVVIVPDTGLDQILEETYDLIILPGGLPGTDNLSASKPLGELLKKQEKEGRLISTICAAACVLSAFDIGLGKSVTSYPSFKSKLADRYNYIDDQLVVHDGQFITSRGPGTAFLFALKLVELLVSVDKAQEISKGLLLNTEYKL